MKMKKARINNLIKNQLKNPELNSFFKSIFGGYQRNTVEKEKIVEAKSICTMDLHLGTELNEIGSSIVQLFMTQENMIFLVSTEIGLTLDSNSKPRIQSSFMSSSLYRV